MVAKTVTRLIDTPRRAVSMTRAGIAIGEDAARQLREAARRIDGVVNDVHAMRQIAERLDERVAHLQRQLDSFNTRVEHIEGVLETVANDVEKGTDRLPDPNEGTIHKLKSALSPTPERGESE